jgi:hypothetical protein
VRPNLYGSNVTAQAFTLGGDTITEWPVGGATNITDGVTSGTYSEATRTLNISNLLAGVSVELPDGIVTNGMGGLLLETNATGASFVKISGSGGEWGNALQVDGSIYLSKWGTSNIRFPSGAYVSGGIFYGNISEMGFKSWLSGAERWVIRSLNGNAYIDNGSLTVAGTNTAASFVTTGTVSAAGAIYQAGELVATTGHVAQAIAGKVDQDSGMATNLWLQGETIVSDSYTNLWWRNVYSNGWHWLVAYTNAPGGAQ